jgi:hypothetical protein
MGRGHERWYYLGSEQSRRCSFRDQGRIISRDVGGGQPQSAPTKGRVDKMAVFYQPQSIQNFGLSNISGLFDLPPGGLYMA